MKQKDQHLKKMPTIQSKSPSEQTKSFAVQTKSSRDKKSRYTQSKS
jgi:hypothetical protein